MRLKVFVLFLLVGNLFLPNKARANTLIYEQDFDGEPVDWRGFVPPPGRWNWQATGGVQGGAFHFYYLPGSTWGGDDFAILLGKDYTDFAYETKIKINKGNAGLQARVNIDQFNNNTNPELGGYRCELTDNGKLKIQRYRLMQADGKVGDYRNPLDLVERAFPFQRGNWYTLRLEIVGNRLRCLVDGEIIAEYTDENSLTPEEINAGITQEGAIFKHGIIGFTTYGFKVSGGESWFDEVRVEAMEEDKDQLLRVLLTNWGTDRSDLNQDGTTNEIDLTIMLNNWD